MHEMWLERQLDLMKRLKIKNYRGTEVHWGKSQSQIMQMLADRDIRDVQFTNISWETATQAGLEMDKGNYAIMLLFQKNMRLPDSSSGKIPVRIIIPNIDQNDARALNQYYRLLHWYLKTKFEAIDTGLVDFAEEFMPHLQITSPTGGIGRVWDMFKQNYYKALGKGEQPNTMMLPPMGGEE